MGRQDLTILMMKAVFVLSIIISQAIGQDTECFSPTPSECAETEISCDMGSYAGCWNGDCWNGDSCMPMGSECPPACYNPAPSTCMDGEILCDMGSSAEGCWHGDVCMPEGSECPAPPEN